MHARSLVAAAAILVLSCGLASGTGPDRGRAPSTTQDAIKQVFVRPFTAATAIPVQTEGWEGGIDALRTQAKASGQHLGPRHGGQRRTGHRLLRGPVREARLVGDRRQGPLPAAGGQRLRRRRRRREPRAGLGPRQVSGHARLGGFLGCREVSRQARPARRRARQPGVRPDRRRRVARRCLQGARARPRASIAHSAGSISSSPTSCGGTTTPRRRASWRPATC